MLQVATNTWHKKQEKQENNKRNNILVPRNFADFIFKRELKLNN